MYGPAVRRKSGIGLVRNEMKTLAAALRLAVEGRTRLYGYELFAQLASWEGQPPMNHGTLYRCLRSLERRGYLQAEVDAGESRPGPARVYYELTDNGSAEARRSTLLLAADEQPVLWVNPRDALVPPPPGMGEAPA